MRERRTITIDFLLTLPLVVLILSEIYLTSLFGEQPDHPAAATAYALAGVLPLALRRVVPLGSLVFLMLISVIGGSAMSDFKPFTLSLVWVIASYSVAAHEPNDRALWGLLAAVLATGFIDAIGGFEDKSTVISVWIFIGAAWWLGRRNRTSRRGAP
jgi:hypothetical protein